MTATINTNEEAMLEGKNPTVEDTQHFKAGPAHDFSCGQKKMSSRLSMHACMHPAPVSPGPIASILRPAMRLPPTSSEVCFEPISADLHLQVRHFEAASVSRNSRYSDLEIDFVRPANPNPVFSCIRAGHPFVNSAFGQLIKEWLLRVTSRTGQQVENATGHAIVDGHL